MGIDEIASSPLPGASWTEVASSSTPRPNMRSATRITPGTSDLPQRARHVAWSAAPPLWPSTTWWSSPCVGNQVAQTTTAQQNIIDYTSAGGRVYATHYGYVWLYDDAPFDWTAKWDVAADTAANQVSGPDTSAVLDPQLSEWLYLVKASKTKGQIPLDQSPRRLPALQPPVGDLDYRQRRGLAAPLHLQHPGRRRLRQPMRTRGVQRLPRRGPPTPPTRARSSRRSATPSPAR